MAVYWLHDIHGVKPFCRTRHQEGYHIIRNCALSLRASFEKSSQCIDVLCLAWCRAHRHKPLAYVHSPQVPLGARTYALLYFDAPYCILVM